MVPEGEALRVVHVHLGIKGGAERFFVSLVNALAERGVEQKALVFPDRVWKKDIEAVCGIEEIAFSRSHIARFFINRRIARMNRRFRPHAMMSWMPQATRWLPDDPNILTAARLGDYPERLDYFVNCDYLVCNTPDIARAAAGIGWDINRTRVISNFTDVRRVAPIDRTQLDTPQDAYAILGMGRFVDRKGFDTLIRAVAPLKGAILWLVGEGPEEPMLRQLAANLGCADRVRFLGWSTDPSPYLAAADALCIPSRHEPLGNVVLEAWAAGKPVVATASEGPSWLIEDSVNGLLAPIDDAAAVSNAFARLIADPTLGPRLVEAASAKLEASHSRKAIADAYIAFLSSGRGTTETKAI